MFMRKKRSTETEGSGAEGGDQPPLAQSESSTQSGTTRFESGAPNRGGRHVSELRALEVAGTILATLFAVVLAPLALKVGAVVFATAVVIRRDEVMGPRGSWPDRFFVSCLALGSVALVALIQWHGGGPSPDEQLDGQLAAIPGFRVQFRGQAELRGPNAGKSFVVVMRDKNTQERPHGDIPMTKDGEVFVPKSDEVRIYDVDDGRVRLSFRFLPQSSGQIRQLPEGDYPSFHFRVVSQTDLTGSGSRELVGAFERVTLATGPMPVPVLIAWDPEAHKFRMSPLIPKPPDLSPLGAKARAAMAGFTRPTTIRDRHSDATTRGYAADAFRVWPRRTSPAVTAFYVDPSTMTRGQVSAWTLDAQNGSIESISCQTMKLAGGLVYRIGGTDWNKLLASAGLHGFAPPCGNL